MRVSVPVFVLDRYFVSVECLNYYLVFCVCVCVLCCRFEMTNMKLILISALLGLVVAVAKRRWRRLYRMLVDLELLEEHLSHLRFRGVFNSQTGAV